MSSPSRPMRRSDLVMDEADAEALLRAACAGRLAAVCADGWPYVVPILFVDEPGVDRTQTPRAEVPGVQAS